MKDINIEFVLFKETAGDLFILITHTHNTHVRQSFSVRMCFWANCYLSICTGTLRDVLLPFTFYEKAIILFVLFVSTTTVYSERNFDYGIRWHKDSQVTRQRGLQKTVREKWDHNANCRWVGCIIHIKSMYILSRNSATISLVLEDCNNCCITPNTQHFKTDQSIKRQLRWSQ